MTNPTGNYHGNGFCRLQLRKISRCCHCWSCGCSKHPRTSMLHVSIRKNLYRHLSRQSSLHQPFPQVAATYFVPLASHRLIRRPREFALCATRSQRIHRRNPHICRGVSAPGMHLARCAHDVPAVGQGACARTFFRFSNVLLRAVVV